MIRKHKIYSKPRKAFDKIRIDAENLLVENYGLNSKREIWKADAAIDKVRRRAKQLITSSPEEQKKLIGRLNKLGLEVERIEDVLALNKEDWLRRRLQSIVFAKKLAKTPKSSRQMIVHRHITINGNIVNIPSYVVRTDEEDKIGITRLKTKEMKAGGKKNE